MSVISPWPSRTPLSSERLSTQTVPVSSVTSRRASFSLPRSTSVSYRASALASRTSAVTSSARASTTESSSLTRWLTRYVPVTFITAQTTSPKVMPISPM